MAKREKREPVVPREVLRAFIKENNLVTVDDVQSAIKDLFADTLQEALEAELDHTLGYAKNDNE
ncbi:MAG TPA: IS256 family transposase, partial [Bacillota bacterium]|nr:IS256 family transposase [Bacillota bacterium]